MAIQQTVVQGTCYDVLGNLANTRLVRVIEARRSGELIEIENQHGVVNESGLLKAADGVSDFKLPRNSQVKLTARIVGLDTTGGVWVTVPDSAGPVDLATLIAVSSIPSTGLTVKSNGVALASLIGTLNVVGDGAVITQTAAGVAELEFTAGAGGGAPTGATYITQTPHASLSAEQALSALATGLLKVTTATGVLSTATAADLPSAIDAAKLADGSVSNAEFQFLANVTSDIQTQINSQLTQAEADALYSVLAHTHSGVYEPANANIQAHISNTSNPHSVTKTQVGLGNVTNDAQLKIASNLADLNNAATARDNLGVEIGADVQGWDADLDALAGLSSTGFVKRTGAGAFSAAALVAGDIPDLSAVYEPIDANITRLGSSIDLSGAEATGILADARFPATLPALSGVNLTALNASNLGSGTVPDARFPATLPSVSGANLTGLTKSQVGLGNVDNVQQQPLDATLTALAGLTVAADKLIYATGADAFAVTDLSSFGRSLIDDADASAGKTTLGLGNVDNTSDANKPISTATQTALDAKAPINASINAQTGTTYTIQASDNGKVVSCSNVSGITVTVPSGLGAGFNCLVVQIGAGQVTFAASSTTINNRQSHTKIAGQYGVATLVAYASNTFALGGDTAL